MALLLGIASTLTGQVPDLGIPEADPKVLMPEAPEQLIRYGKDLEVTHWDGDQLKMRCVLTHLQDSIVRITTEYDWRKRPFTDHYVLTDGHYLICNKRGRLKRSFSNKEPAIPITFDTLRRADTLIIIKRDRWFWKKDTVGWETTWKHVDGRLIERHEKNTAWHTDSHIKYRYVGDSLITKIDSSYASHYKKHRVYRTEYIIENNGSAFPVRVILNIHRPDQVLPETLIYDLTYADGICVEEMIHSSMGYTSRRVLRFL